MLNRFDRRGRIAVDSGCVPRRLCFDSFFSILAALLLGPTVMIYLSQKKVSPFWGYAGGWWPPPRGSNWRPFSVTLALSLAGAGFLLQLIGSTRIGTKLLASGLEPEKEELPPVHTSFRETFLVSLAGLVFLLALSPLSPLMTAGFLPVLGSQLPLSPLPVFFGVIGLFWVFLPWLDYIRIKKTGPPLIGQAKAQLQKIIASVLLLIMMVPAVLTPVLNKFSSKTPDKQTFIDYYLNGPNKSYYRFTPQDEEYLKIAKERGRTQELLIVETPETAYLAALEELIGIRGTDLLDLTGPPAPKLPELEMPPVNKQPLNLSRWPFKTSWGVPAQPGNNCPPRRVGGCGSAVTNRRPQGSRRSQPAIVRTRQKKMFASSLIKFLIAKVPYVGQVYAGIRKIVEIKDYVQLNKYPWIKYHPYLVEGLREISLVTGVSEKEIVRVMLWDKLKDVWNQEDQMPYLKSKGWLMPEQKLKF